MKSSLENNFKRKSYLVFKKFLDILFALLANVVESWRRNNYRKHANINRTSCLNQSLGNYAKKHF